MSDTLKKVKAPGGNIVKLVSREVLHIEHCDIHFVTAVVCCGSSFIGSHAGELGG